MERNGIRNRHCGLSPQSTDKEVYSRFRRNDAAFLLLRQPHKLIRLFMNNA
jgi:hypothetical protein